MIRLHVSDTGMSVRVLGFEVAAITDDRTPEPRHTPLTPTVNAVTNAPRVLRAALRFMKDTTR